jgi:CheY-like chemotaxis protein
MSDDPKSRLVLLVEDNSADVDLVIDMLDTVAETERFDIHHVANLGEARTFLDGHAADVILLDLRLPDGVGVDCVTAIIGAAQNTPIVVLTGMEDEQLGQLCIDAGAQDYLSKNEIRPAHLRRAIGFAITRLREAQLRELNSLLDNYRSLASSGALSPVTAALAGVGTIRNTHPEVHDQFVAEYSRIFSLYLEQLGIRAEKPRSLMERLVTQVGDRGGGPRDLLDLHVEALELAMVGASKERARVLVLEGRLLALEMMGILVDYYRVGNRRYIVSGGLK